MSPTSLRKTAWFTQTHPSQPPSVPFSPTSFNPVSLSMMVSAISATEVLFYIFFSLFKIFSISLIRNEFKFFSVSLIRNECFKVIGFFLTFCWCLKGVKWVIKADKYKKIKFCCVQSKTAEPYLRVCGVDREDVLRRFVFIEGLGAYHQGSTGNCFSFHLFSSRINGFFFALLLFI